jgi:hypothetical protein
VATCSSLLPSVKRWVFYPKQPQLVDLNIINST